MKGLECCSAMSGEKCRKCPYSSECLDENFPVGMSHLAADALWLLKTDGCENCAMAVEDRQMVVRCKDCKWAEVSDNERTWCDHVDHDFCHNNDWFCADGQKKDGGDNAE